MRLLLAFGVLSIGVSTLELRCYCNLPSCIQTAYMCKSSLACFQEVDSPSESVPSVDSRIGCLELWPKKHGFYCLQLQQADVSLTSTERSALDGPQNLQKDAPVSLLRCCLEDMCNYVAQSEPELSISVINEPGTILNSDEYSISERSNVKQLRISQTLWFKIAVVAVPVVGVIILLVLFLLARSMLNADWRVHDSDQLLSSSDLQYSLPRPLRQTRSEGALLWPPRTRQCQMV